MSPSDSAAEAAVSLREECYGQRRPVLILLDVHTVRHLVQLGQQLGGDGEGVTPGEGQHLAGVAEAGAHHDGVVAVLLVVVVDLPHTQHSGVLLSLVRLVVFCLISES